MSYQPFLCEALKESYGPDALEHAAPHGELPAVMWHIVVRIAGMRRIFLAIDRDRGDVGVIRVLEIDPIDEETLIDRHDTARDDIAELVGRARSAYDKTIITVAPEWAFLMEKEFKAFQ